MEIGEAFVLDKHAFGNGGVLINFWSLLAPLGLCFPKAVAALHSAHNAPTTTLV